MPRSHLDNQLTATDARGRDNSANNVVVHQEMLAESPGRHQIVEAEAACGSGVFTFARISPKRCGSFDSYNQANDGLEQRVSIACRS